MYSISEELKAEHHFILQYFERWQQTIAQHSQLIDDDFFCINNHFVAFFQQFLDEFHHAKEEQVLFMALQRPGVLQHCNPVNQMMLEHSQGREHLTKIRRYIGDRNLDSLTQSVDAYAADLTLHIFKENNILYPMAEEVLSELQKSDLLEQYDEHNRRLGKDSLWKKYQTFLATLL